MVESYLLPREKRERGETREREEERNGPRGRASLTLTAEKKSRIRAALKSPPFPLAFAPISCLASNLKIFSFRRGSRATIKTGTRQQTARPLSHRIGLTIEIIIDIIIIIIETQNKLLTRGPRRLSLNSPTDHLASSSQG